MDYTYKQAIYAENYRWLKTKTLSHIERLTSLGVTNMGLQTGDMSDPGTKRSQEAQELMDKIQDDLEKRRMEAIRNSYDIEPDPQDKRIANNALYKEAKAFLNTPVGKVPPSWANEYVAVMDRSAGVTTHYPTTEAERWKCVKASQQYWLNK